MSNTIDAASPTTPGDTWDAVAAAWATHADFVDAGKLAATAALVAHLAVQPGDRVLELCAGPGSLGATWSQLAGPSGRVVLSDAAPGMVAAAAARNSAHANVDVVQLDLAAIDRSDATFDAVACRMGLMFVTDPSAALAEIRRVLAPGGRFAALVWAGIEHNPWMTSVGMAAMVNGVVSGGPPVGPGQIFSLGDPTQLAELAAGAGFAEVAVTEHSVRFVSDTIDAHVARVSSLAGPLAGAFAAATPDQLAAMRATAAQLAAPHITEAGVDLPGRALLVAARV